MWRAGMWDGKPQFLVKPPRYATAEIVEFVKAKAGVENQRRDG